MSETAVATARQFLLFTAALTTIELLVPARPTQRPLRRGTAIDLLFFFASPLVVGFAGSALLGAASAAAARVMPSGVRAGFGVQPFALQLVEMFLLSEVSGYWLHRWSHERPWLWRFHAVHHSNVELDWLAATRQHPLEALWLLCAANVPVVLLGFSVEPLLAFVLAQRLYTAFLHANVRIGYGRFTLLLASPQFHHWHHDGASRPARNFASTLPWLDWLWGTYELPARFPARYGIS
jgi:sterol desaturase/sphingolipid hydroxylase (fatty acid hydroxylase superfamily)